MTSSTVLHAADERNADSAVLPLGEHPAARDVVAPGWEAFYEAHEQAAYSFARGLLRNPQDAQDITQEAFWRAFKWWNATPAPSRAWLFRIVHNLAMDRHRRHQLVRFFSFEWVSKQTGPSNEWEWEFQTLQSALVADDDTEGDVLGRETEREVREVLSRLTFRERALLTLKAQQGMDYDGMAAVLQTTRTGIKSALWRARNRFALTAKQLGYWDGWNGPSRPVLEPLA